MRTQGGEGVRLCASGLGDAGRTGKRGMAWWAARGWAGGQTRNMPAGLCIACVAAAFRPASLDLFFIFPIRHAARLAFGLLRNFCEGRQSEAFDLLRPRGVLRSVGIQGGPTGMPRCVEAAPVSIVHFGVSPCPHATCYALARAAAVDRGAPRLLPASCAQARRSQIYAKFLCCMALCCVKDPLDFLRH